MSKVIVTLLLFAATTFIPLAYAEEGQADLSLTAETGKTVSNGNRQFYQAVPLRMIISDTRIGAVEILSEIKRGKPFFFAAHDRSADRKSAQEYGYLGEIDPLILDPAVRETLVFLEEGHVSGIIKLGDGRYALIEVRKNSFYNEGEKAFMMRDVRNAELLLMRHLELNPDDIKARMMIAAIYDEQKETLKAEDALDQAISFKPKAAEPYERLGKLYMKQGGYWKARDIFRKGLKHTPASRIFEKLLEITEIQMIGAAD